MKKIIAIFIVLSTSGCFDDTADLKEHIAKVQASTPKTIRPMPAVPVFDHFDYSVQSLRSPFDKPRAEAIQERIQKISGCLSPDTHRQKQPLEKFALSDLSMRGTLSGLDMTWALIQASDATIHRVTVGNFLGLYHGRITNVNQSNVKVTELIPDGTGCWVKRETIIVMVESGTEGQRK